MAEKMLQMHAQMRQNQREITDFLTDIDSWTSDIKKQDDNLKKMKPREQAVSAQAPIRSAPVIEKVKRKRQEGTEKPERIKSSDYRMWEKLDVDSMLKQVDDEEKEMEEEIQVEVEKLDEERRAKVAAEMKQKGNEHFKNSGFQAAIECYTTGMQADPASPIFPANRAMAYLKLKRYAETEADCTLSLSLDPTYTKAYLRRGSARVALGKASSARKDFLAVLKLEPGNTQAQKEISKLDKVVHKDANERQVKESNSKNDSKYVKPIHIPPNLRSKKPLMRVEVQEIGMELPESGNKVCKEDLPDIMEPAPISHTETRTPVISVISEESNGGCIADDGNRISDPSTQLNEINITENATSLGGEVKEKKKPDLVNESSRKAFSTENEKASNSTVVIPPPPGTSFQFQFDVKQLSRHSQQLYEYLRQVPPSSIPSLLKQQIETETMIPLLECLRLAPEGDEVAFEYLEFLTKVKRFEMAVLFMNDEEQRVVEALFVHLSTSYPERLKDVSRLRKKYGLTL